MGEERKKGQKTNHMLYLQPLWKHAASDSYDVFSKGNIISNASLVGSKPTGVCSIPAGIQDGWLRTVQGQRGDARLDENKGI